MEEIINKLRAYIHCEDCGNRHYLSFNKDIQGRWSAGYIEYRTHTAIHGGNEFNTLEEAAKFLEDDLRDVQPERV